MYYPMSYAPTTAYYNIHKHSVTWQYKVWAPGKLNGEGEGKLARYVQRFEV